jgi:hypothetical protein
MKNNLIFVVVLGLTHTCNTLASSLTFKAQDDTVLVNNAYLPPVFDGIDNDICWESASWQTIDQVWIPWGTIMDPADFSGRYKMVWSSNENVLYFLLEIIDDVVSDAYIPGETAAIYNFDMFEVFIDEDKSGGYHVFDGAANDEASLGLNAENAFAYHIFTQFPSSGETSETFRAEDMGGTGWGNSDSKLYNDHFTHFILRKIGNISTWEFALKVFDDTYNDTNIEGSRVTLTADKVLGLSIAYNDDDEPEIDPSLTERDNFIGSVAVTAAAYNDHWKNANDFGTIKLLPVISGINTQNQLDDMPVILYPNPARKDFFITIDNDYFGPFSIKMYDNTGKGLSSYITNKDSDLFSMNFSNKLEAGLYLIEFWLGDFRYFYKLSLID